MSQDIAPLDFAKTKSNYVLLDVREEDELAIAKLSPCLHIPLNELPLKVETLDKSKTYVTLCRSGQRSQRAADFLRSQGFKVLNMTGGINRYSKEVDSSIPRY